MKMELTERERVTKEFTRSILNTFTDPDDFIEAMLNEHRTIQQNFTRLVADYLSRLAEQFDEGRFDARNQASVEFAKKVQERVLAEGVGFPYI